MSETARDRFLTLVRTALAGDTLIKLTLGKPHAGDPTLRNVYIRPVNLKRGPHLAFVFRHATRDITKNHPAEAALAEVEALVGSVFLDAHLFTTTQQVQLTDAASGGRLRTKTVNPTTAPSREHDQSRQHAVPADAPWLQALGVTNPHGQPRSEMSAKYRQIQKFAELMGHLITEAPLPTDRPWQIADMGCGKGYLTFAVAALLGDRAVVRGIERRADLVDLDNRVARECGLANLEFVVGDIGTGEAQPIDILIALHACDTATDDALAQGIAAQAALLVVAPCCQKELRPQLTAPPVLAGPLQHGIFQERQAEFVTDALRAQLLEWAGWRTKVFEFISTEHTAKNLMIAGLRDHAPGDSAKAQAVRDLAAFYGIRQQQLARHLGFKLEP